MWATIDDGVYDDPVAKLARLKQGSSLMT